MINTTAKNALWDIAVNQHGYVTAAQARELSITKSAISMLVARGTIERAGHGVYRFPQIPQTQYDPYALAVLWTGAQEAALSHETALDAYEICDVNPHVIHIVVGKNRRIRRSQGEQYRIHYENIDASDIGWWQEIPIIKAAKAIAQCMEYGTPTYLLVQAIDKGYAKGYLQKKEHDALTESLEKCRG
jgi:predicted transcriptional regulator of viral defense system